MATWNYGSTASFIGTVDLDSSGNIINLDDSATAASTKNFTIKGLKTPIDDATDIDDYGAFGNALSSIFNVGFTLIKSRVDAELEV